MAQGISRPISVTVFSCLTSAVTTSTATSNLKDTSAQIPSGAAVDLYLTCTNQGANLSGTLDVALDVSPDGGTTWFEAERFARISTSTGNSRISFRPTGIGAVEAAAGAWTVTGSSNFLANNVALPPDQRIRYQLNNNSGSSAAGSTAAFAVFAVVQPTGTAGFA